MKLFSEKEKKKYYKRAMRSVITRWSTQNKDILMISGVAFWLATNSYLNKWKTDDKEILLLSGVAQRLATHSDDNGWTTQDKDILMIPDVALWLTFNSRKTAWTSTDLEILMIPGANQIRVYDLLYKYGNLSEELYTVCRANEEGKE